jgi:hypothetical protein
MFRNSVNILRSFSATLLLIPLATFSAQAQQVTGTPGSPGATTTITGNQLPPLPPKFGGVIKDKASESTPWWAPQWCHPRARPTCC